MRLTKLALATAVAAVALGSAPGAFAQRSNAASVLVVNYQRVVAESALGRDMSTKLQGVGTQTQQQDQAMQSEGQAIEAEDQRLAEQMLHDEKERAEHVMLVDLGRNDLGRVSEYGSVKVKDLMYVERYSHVMHIVSALEGRLRPELHALDAFVACFPAGTLSGAPKVRAMQIIEELEPTRRGIYGGSVLYADFAGNLDSCIAIRTMLMKGRKAYLQAGAGIVADSDPTTEYQESMNKAQAVLRAVEAARGGTG
jgi:anthranilate synthase component 1